VASMAETQTTFIDKSRTFFREAYAELKKVSWPTPKDIWGSSVVVLIFVTIFTLLTMLIDFLLSKGISLILK
jgi:preprotein translocase subunit SecE